MFGRMWYLAMKWPWYRVGQLVTYKGRRGVFKITKKRDGKYFIEPYRDTIGYTTGWVGSEQLSHLVMYVHTKGKTRREYETV